MASECVVFNAADSDASDVWDDTALIDAYDRAVRSIRLGSQEEEKDKQKQSKKPKKSSKKKKHKNSGGQSSKPEIHQPESSVLSRWRIGDGCSAQFSEDGLFYDAEVLSISKASQTCTVRYKDYGNEEEHKLSDLWPEDSHMETEESTVNTTTRPKCGHHSVKWNVSDLCRAPESPSRHHHEAVINNFPSPNTCKVTFLRSRKSEEVNINHLQPTAGTPSGQKRPFPTSPPQHPHIPGYHHLPGPPPPPPPPPFMQTPYGSFPSFSAPPWAQQAFSSSRAPTPPMPPVPTLPTNLPDDEALSQMLMSWYMTGYHTGYYQGLRQSKGADQSNVGNSTHIHSTTNGVPEEQAEST